MPAGLLFEKCSQFLNIYHKLFSDETENACHGSETAAAAARELEFFFPTKGRARQNTAKYSDCTCCVIKPHAVQAGKMGSFLFLVDHIRRSNRLLLHMRTRLGLCCQSQLHCHDWQIIFLFEAYCLCK